MNTDTSRHDAAAREEARAEALRDSDSLTDWLSGECYQAPVSKWQSVLRDKTAADFASLPTRDLVALLFDCGQPMQTTRAVRDCLAERFVDREAIKACIEGRASVLAVEMAYSELEAA